MSKKLQEKQQRRRAEQARKSAQRRAQRRTNLVTLGVAVAVGLLVVVAIVSQKSAENRRAEANFVSAEQAACTDIERPDEQPADHLGPGEGHPPYSSDPPTSGPHLPDPAQAGFFETPLPPERVVHNLEHGQIVIWYRSDAPTDVVDAVQALVDEEPIATLATPYDGIEEPHNVVFTAWGAMRSCEGVARSIVDDFRALFQGKSPEPRVPRFETT